MGKICTNISGDNSLLWWLIICATVTAPQEKKNTLYPRENNVAINWTKQLPYKDWSLCSPLLLKPAICFFSLLRCRHEYNSRFTGYLPSLCRKHTRCRCLSSHLLSGNKGSRGQPWRKGETVYLSGCIFSVCGYSRKSTIAAALRFNKTWITTALLHCVKGIHNYCRQAEGEKLARLF